MTMLVVKLPTLTIKRRKPMETKGKNVSFMVQEKVKI